MYKFMNGMFQAFIAFRAFFWNDIMYHLGFVLQLAYEIELSFTMNQIKYNHLMLCFTQCSQGQNSF